MKYVCIYLCISYIHTVWSLWMPWNLWGWFTCDGFLIDVFLMWIDIYQCQILSDIQAISSFTDGGGLESDSIYLHILVDIPPPCHLACNLTTAVPPRSKQQRYPEDFLAKTRGVDPDQRRWWCKESGFRGLVFVELSLDGGQIDLLERREARKFQRWL